MHPLLSFTPSRYLLPEKTSLSPPHLVLIFGFLVLLFVGIFVTEFIGNRIIISDLKGEKKLEEKTLEEIETEDKLLHNLEKKIDRIEALLKSRD